MAESSAPGAENTLPSGVGWFAAVGSSQFVTYDLGSVQQVVSLGVEAANAEAAPKDVEVQASASLDFAAAPAAQILCGHGCHVYPLPSPQVGRFVRVRVTSNHGAHYVGINAVELHGLVKVLDLPPGAGDQEQAEFSYVSGPLAPGADAARLPLSQPITASRVTLQICENAGAFYTGVNRAWLVDEQGERVLAVQPVAVNGGRGELATLPVGLGGRGKNGWWTALGGRHSIALDLGRPTTVAAMDMWAANDQACPTRCRLSGPPPPAAAEALGAVVRACNGDASVRLGPRAGALLGLLAADGDPRPDDVALESLRRYIYIYIYMYTYI